VAGFNRNQWPESIGIGGRFRSEYASDTRMGLMSLLGTWQAQGKPLLESLTQTLLSPTPA